MTIYVGGDASKGYADFALVNDALKRLQGSKAYDDTPSGHQSLLEALQAVQQQAPPGEAVQFVIGLEGSGGLERNWLHTLSAFTEGTTSRVYQLNPLAVRRFRQRELHGSVTDARSAKTIAEYLKSGLRAADVPYAPQHEGARMLYHTIANQLERLAELKNELQSLLPSVQPELVQFCRGQLPKWVTHLLVKYPTAPQLARARVSTLARIPYVTPARAKELQSAARQSVGALQDPCTGIALCELAQETLRLSERIVRLKAQLCELLKDDPDRRLLESIPGLGAWAASVLLLEVGDFRRFRTAAALVSFAGLDATYEQSGDGEVRYSISKKGRSRVRAELYMPTLAGRRYNPALREFYVRLKQRGKHGMVAIIACMVKLLRIAYACVLSGKPFDPAHHVRLRAKYEAAQAVAAQRKEAARRVSPPAGEAAATVASGSLTAPISAREARRRRAATAPQAGGPRPERGHGAALPHTTPPLPACQDPVDRDQPDVQGAPPETAPP